MALGGPGRAPEGSRGAPVGSMFPDRMVFTRVQACRIHDCTVFTRLQGPETQLGWKNSMKNRGCELIPGSRGFPGSRGSRGFPGNGVRSCSSDPPFHAQEPQDDVSSQANSLKQWGLCPLHNRTTGWGTTTPSQGSAPSLTSQLATSVPTSQLTQGAGGRRMEFLPPATLVG